MSLSYNFAIDSDVVTLKVHLNLSEKAWMTIDEDRKNFYDSETEGPLAGIINQVFANFYQYAEASIHIRLQEKEKEIDAFFASGDFRKTPEDTIQLIKVKALSAYSSQLQEKAFSYPKFEGRKITLQKDNLEILRESPEAEYYQGSIGSYLKAILEEYVSKPTYIREQIFFASTMRNIQYAIDNELKLKITQKEKVSVKGDLKYRRSFNVCPYKVVQDKTRTYNYLVGYSKQLFVKKVDVGDGKIAESYEEGEEQECSLRISRINKSRTQLSMGAHISKAKANHLDEMLAKKGAMFMSGELIQIKVQFTNKGLESFRRWLYMRPQSYTVDPSNDHIYLFDCTEFQALNYFFKFGWDAKILEPLSLQEKFKKRYETAYKTYTGITKEELLAQEKAEREAAMAKQNS